MTLSILQSRLIEKDFKKTENSEQCGVTVVFIYARQEEEEETDDIQNKKWGKRRSRIW